MKRLPKRSVRRWPSASAAAALMGLESCTTASVVQDVAACPATGEMIKSLARDHLAVAHQMRAAVEQANAARDAYSADLLTARILSG